MNMFLGSLILSYTTLVFGQSDASNSEAQELAKAETRSKQLCQQLEAAKLTEVKVINTKQKSKIDILDLTVKTRFIDKTVNLSKKCVLKNGGPPVKSGLLGEFNQKKFYYQVCGYEGSEQSDAQVGIFEGVSGDEVQKIFSSDSIDENQNEGAQFDIPQFAIHQGVPLLKISWTISGTGAFHSAQYYYFDSKYWKNLDTYSWSKVIDKILPKDRESHYFADIDLKALVASLAIRQPDKDEWRKTGWDEDLLIQLKLNKDRLEPTKISCKRYPYK